MAERQLTGEGRSLGWWWFERKEEGEARKVLSSLDCVGLAWSRLGREGQPATCFPSLSMKCVSDLFQGVRA